LAAIFITYFRSRPWLRDVLLPYGLLNAALHMLSGGTALTLLDLSFV